MKFKNMRPDGKRVPSSKVLSNLKPGTLPVAMIAFIIIVGYALVNWLPKSPAKPDATWTHIIATGTFRIGIDPSFPPFESEDGKGHLKGLDIALVDEMVQQWSREVLTTTVRVEYIYTGFDGLYDALKAGQFDAIVSALPYDPKRTEDVRFSMAYFDGGPYIVVREQDITTKTYADLQGKPIGIELGSTGDAFARRWQKRFQYALHEFNLPGDALRALKQGEVDAVFTDLIAFNEFARTNAGVKTVGTPLVHEYLVVAVRKDSPTLLAQINTVITAMKNDGRLERLYKQWLIGGGQ
jgi:ABC-type amino acid transport substrate-binding protein